MSLAQENGTEDRAFAFDPDQTIKSYDRIAFKAGGQWSEFFGMGFFDRDSPRIGQQVFTRDRIAKPIDVHLRNLVSEIGNKINPETATHEFIGLAKFSKTGTEQFIQTYLDCTENYRGRFQEAEDITLSTFTDLIQEMIDRGFVINFLEIHKGWMESDYLINHFLHIGGGR